VENKLPHVCDATQPPPEWPSRTLVDHRRHSERVISVTLSRSLPFRAAGAPADIGVVFVSLTAQAGAFSGLPRVSSLAPMCVCVLSSSTHCMSLIIICRRRSQLWIIYCLYYFFVPMLRCCRVNYIALAFLCNKAHRTAAVFMCVCAHVNKNEVQCQRGKHNARG
jgi:hypothetical protein